jgi:hypothetical protein
MEHKSSCRLFNIRLSISMVAALVIPLAFILATTLIITTTTMTGPAVYAYRVMETARDNQEQLNFVSTMTTTNASSSFGGENATSNSTMTDT